MSRNTLKNALDVVSKELNSLVDIVEHIDASISKIVDAQVKKEEVTIDFQSVDILNQHLKEISKITSNLEKVCPQGIPINLSEIVNLEHFSNQFSSQDCLERDSPDDRGTVTIFI